MISVRHFNNMVTSVIATGSFANMLYHRNEEERLNKKNSQIIWFMEQMSNYIDYAFAHAYIHDLKGNQDDMEAFFIQEHV